MSPIDLWDSACPYERLAAMEMVRKPYLKPHDLIVKWQLPDDAATRLQSLATLYRNHPDYEKWLTSQGHVLKTALEPRTPNKSDR